MGGRNAGQGSERDAGAPRDVEGAPPTERLVFDAKAGDRAALEALFARYLPRVRQIVALRLGRRLRDLLELDDVVQEVLASALKRFDRFKQTSEGGFRHWLARMVERHITDQARRFAARKRGGGRVRRAGDLPSSVLSGSMAAGRHPSPSEVAMARETEERLEKALLALSERDRELIVLRKLCGMSYEEIAETLGTPGEAENVRRAFSRALWRLAKELERPNGANGRRDSGDR